MREGPSGAGNRPPAPEARASLFLVGVAGCRAAAGIATTGGGCRQGGRRNGGWGKERSGGALRPTRRYKGLCFSFSPLAFGGSCRSRAGGGPGVGVRVALRSPSFATEAPRHKKGVVATPLLTTLCCGQVALPQGQRRHQLGAVGRFQVPIPSGGQQCSSDKADGRGQPESTGNSCSSRWSCPRGERAWGRVRKRLLRRRWGGRGRRASAVPSSRRIPHIPMAGPPPRGERAPQLYTPVRILWRSGHCWESRPHHAAFTGVSRRRRDDADCTATYMRPPHRAAALASRPVGSPPLLGLLPPYLPSSLARLPHTNHLYGGQHAESTCLLGVRVHLPTDNWPATGCCAEHPVSTAPTREQRTHCCANRGQTATKRCGCACGETAAKTTNKRIRRHKGQHQSVATVSERWPPSHCPHSTVRPPRATHANPPSPHPPVPTQPVRSASFSRGGPAAGHHPGGRPLP